MQYDIYRFYSKNRLIYVGLSLNAFIRLVSHKKSPWWNRITIMTVERFEADRRELAELREKMTIYMERPIFNCAHNSFRRRGPKRTARKQHLGYRMDRCRDCGRKLNLDVTYRYCRDCMGERRRKRLERLRMKVSKDNAINDKAQNSD